MLSDHVVLRPRRFAVPLRSPVLEVDADGLLLRVHGSDRVLDVLFDGRRIWSFWAARDTTRRGVWRRHSAWPQRMRRFLDGRARVTVREHVSGRVLFDADMAFGTSEDPIAFVNNRGLEISLDKSGRFTPEFSVRTEEQLAPLLRAIETVVDVVGELGVKAFLAYGTLLGAVREGQFLGHDSDADLGYVSAHTAPVDVIRESFRLQRELTDRGFVTHRYSGLAFQIDVEEADGSKRGLDLFGGFLSGEGDVRRLYLMGEVGQDFQESWLHPLGSASLAGAEFPVPARPEKLLEAMYGPSWRVPDPAFQFTTSPGTVSRLNSWFRGMSTHRQEWTRERVVQPGRRQPASALARLVAEHAPDAGKVLDVGAGRGHDALFLAEQGLPTVAYDFVPRALQGAAKVAARKDLPLDVRELNLLDLRSVLLEGARLSRQDDGVRVMLARHVLDATTAKGREGLYRFASMTLRGGGQLYAEVWLGGGPAPFGLRRLSCDDVVAEIEEYGGSPVAIEQDEQDDGAVVARIVTQW
jgi:SAM-dependent methyltransferase